jgi:nucleotide-binding universal stress UspA family protein
MRHFQRLLVVVDAGAPTHAALDCAASLAQRHGAALKIVDVVPEHLWLVRQMAPDYEHIRELYTKEKSDFLDAAAASLRNQGLVVTTKVLFGRSSLEIIREVLRENHDLVLKEAKGRRSRRTGFFGTTALRLLRDCPCDVWLTRPGHAGPNQQVLAAVDASPGDDAHANLNRKILDLAVAAACGDCDRLHVAYAWNIVGEDLLRSRLKPKDFARLEEGVRADNESYFQRLLADYGLNPDDLGAHLLHGDAHNVIPDLVRRESIDVLAIGTVARAGLGGLVIGNTAEALLDRVECSLLATKPEGFVSPIRLEHG